MEQELKTFQLVALTPCGAEHNQPPTAQRNATGVLGRVGNGKEDPKSQQGNFRWQEANV